MGKIFKILFNCLLVLTIIVLTGYLILRVTNKIKIYNVETGSMEDKIHAGDYILLYKKDNYKVGDVVTYRVRDYFITHRIMKIENDKVTTKGDANNTEDAQINFNQIEGKAIYWGGILNFIINFKFAIIALLVGLYLLSCYFGDDKVKVKDKEEQVLDTNNNDITEIKLEDVIKKEENTPIAESEEEKIIEIEKIIPETEIIKDLKEDNEIKETKIESIKMTSTETKKKTTKSNGKKATGTKSKKTASIKSANTKTKKVSSTKTTGSKAKKSASTKTASSKTKTITAKKSAGTKKTNKKTTKSKK